MKARYVTTQQLARLLGIAPRTARLRVAQIAKENPEHVATSGEGNGTRYLVNLAAIPEADVEEGLFLKVTKLEGRVRLLEKQVEELRKKS